MTTTIRRIGYPLLLIAVAAVTLVSVKDCSGKVPKGGPFSSLRAQTSTIPKCTPAYGMCDVIEFILVQPNGSHKIVTCYAQPPVIEGHGGVRVQPEYCVTP